MNNEIVLPDGGISTFVVSAEIPQHALDEDDCCGFGRGTGGRAPVHRSGDDEATDNRDGAGVAYGFGDPDGSGYGTVTLRQLNKRILRYVGF